MKATYFIIFSILVSNFSFSQSINQVDLQGKKQGELKKYYEKSGRVLYEGRFKDDKPTGVFRFYYENGSKKALIDHNLTSGRSLANSISESVSPTIIVLVKSILGNIS